MTNIALRVENLGKKYRIGAIHEPYSTLRDTITRSVTAPFRRISDLLRGQAYAAADLQREIWALRDISFEVKHGEVLGIIGRNGAGKSTLLKILSRITEPSTGYADLYGRVGALLEVGTGFHPELSGRENVYLNGAILGMSRDDIERKFDEIVAFAGVEKFIDTPVKHYSSGMGLRLGFAVAAHLEPDILVVDEVLAVGDAEFQKKCLGRMSDVASEGRTVLFVSHNMGAVQNLCARAILLEEGHIIHDDETRAVINRYLGGTNTGVTDLSELPRIRPYLGKKVRLEKTRITSGSEGEATTLLFGEILSIEVTFRYLADMDDVCIFVGIDSSGFRITTAASEHISVGFSGRSGDVITVRVTLNDLWLSPGTYWLTYSLRDVHAATGQNDDLDHMISAQVFNVSTASHPLWQTKPMPGNFWYGVVQAKVLWEII